tara:strand:- start:133 stop:375 length:243 start_codon:yes stop_codon:yes gene_type:complete
VNIEFKEIELDWPSDLSILELKNYILSKLIGYGEPLRWAITSITNYSEQENQIIFIEVVLIINRDKEKGLNFDLNRCLDD